MSVGNLEEPLRGRVYLDHAATSWPKLPGVNAAWLKYQEFTGVTAGRGNYRSAVAAQSIVDDVRRRLSRLIGSPTGDSIAMVHNGTAALNLAFAGLLRSGDHVVTTAAEHNSVLRPLHAIQKSLGITLTVAECDEYGWVDPQVIERSIQPQTRLVAVTHASNVTGRIQDIAEIAATTKLHSCLLLVDAAQTIGYIPIEVDKWGVDLLAAPGHKGAGGVMGTGLLYAHPAVASQIRSPWPGGSGTRSESLDGPEIWPTNVEAGNLNVPAIAAWQAGLQWMEQNGLLGETSDDSDFGVNSRRLRDILRRLRCFEMIGHDDDSDQYVPVISLRCNKTVGPSDLAAILDSSFGIEVRSGLHCAALIHHRLNTMQDGGTVRFSIGHTTTANDLDRLEQAVENMNEMLG